MLQHSSFVAMYVFSVEESPAWCVCTNIDTQCESLPSLTTSAYHNDVSLVLNFFAMRHHVGHCVFSYPVAYAKRVQHHACRISPGFVHSNYELKQLQLTIVFLCTGKDTTTPYTLAWWPNC